MRDRFEHFLKNSCNIAEGDEIILAVSGGIDSVVMLELFSTTACKLTVAHCNFGLRARESDGDENFVRELGESKGIEVRVKNFETDKYAEEKKISIQMAARDLRYDWFNSLMEDSPSAFLATAHNLNDQVETFFINLARGTGIRGLTGIKARNARIIRPLLWAERSMIAEFAGSEGLKWREDSSNSETKYTRNKIRHEIIPLLQMINPAFNETMQLNLKRLRDVEQIYVEEIEKRKHYLLINEDNHWKIHFPSLLREENYKIWLYEILQDFGFSAGTVDDICLSIQKHESGKLFYSDNCRLVKDREFLLIDPRLEEESRRFYVEEGQEVLDEPLQLKIEQINIDNFRLEKDPGIAQLDFDKLNFPLIIRKWQQGDYFMPLGMQNLKKLSDFFIDQKMSIPAKEKIWILASGKHIVWVIGKRIDDRYKVTEDTEVVLKLSLH